MLGESRLAPPPFELVVEGKGAQAILTGVVLHLDVREFALPAEERSASPSLLAAATASSSVMSRAMIEAVCASFMAISSLSAAVTAAAYAVSNVPR